MRKKYKNCANSREKSKNKFAKFEKSVKKFKLSFAKTSVASIFIFALTFCAWLNFAPRNLENANAENSENAQKNSQNFVQNSENSPNSNSQNPANFAQISANANEISPTPFDPRENSIFLTDSTQLFHINQNVDGFTFEKIGGKAGFGYNSIGYNTVDNFIYATASDTHAEINQTRGDLLRIDSGGNVENLGSVGLPDGHIFYSGAFDENGIFYVYQTGGNYAITTLYAVDVARMTSREIALSQPIANDFAFFDGYFWSITTNARDSAEQGFFRINLNDGKVDFFAAAEMNLDEINFADNFGAAWIFGNGDLGVVDSTAGSIYEISIVNPHSAKPTFNLVAFSSGATDVWISDGTSSPGAKIITETPIYRVDFDPKGGSEIPPQNVADGKTAILPDPPSKKDGNDFEFWYVCSDFAQKQYDFATEIHADVKLCAKWTEKVENSPELEKSDDAAQILPPNTGKFSFAKFFVRNDRTFLCEKLEICEWDSSLRSE